MYWNTYFFYRFYELGVVGKVLCIRYFGAGVVRNVKYFRCCGAGFVAACVLEHEFLDIFCKVLWEKCYGTDNLKQLL